MILDEQDDIRQLALIDAFLASFNQFVRYQNPLEIDEAIQSLRKRGEKALASPF